MTREQAIQELEELKPLQMSEHGDCECLNVAIKALEQETVSKESYDHEYFLRKELDLKVARLEKQIAEQEPCEDAVSRQAVLDELRTCFDTHSIYDENNGENYIIYEDAVDMMEELPSVTPTISEIDKFNDSVNRATVLSLISDVQNADGFKDYSQYEYLFDQVDKMPMATPTRKVGKWIEIKNKNGKVIALRCNCCEKSPKHAIRSLWCPNCGADMRGGEE